ncbi:FAD-binding oxidoreductase [Rubrobacter marinus]|nr:FAD-binding oxidoreductase [Rubrobacter marinus]
MEVDGMGSDLKSALRTIEEAFGDRLKHEVPWDGRSGDDASLFVQPRNAGEVEYLAGVAARFGVPLVALGAGTARSVRAGSGSILVRFDLMRGVKVRGNDEMWVRAEPGASWLELDEALGTRGWGLAVYPTSAPRATVGGWLAEDGIGVGSYRYGRTRENVLSADVVLPEGRRTVRGEELGDVIDAAGGKGIVVAATIRTRHADHDVPFALAFPSPEDLAGAVAEVHRAYPPLWHLAFLNDAMSRARGLGDDHLLFGAYSGGGTKAVEETLGEAAASYGGRILTPAGAYRVWGQRFFPIAPSRPAPIPADRSFVSLAEIRDILEGRGQNTVQGTVSRSGEVLVLDLGAAGEPAR